MRLIALEEITYDGKTNKPGDPFDASDHDGDLLIKVGKAKEKYSGVVNPFLDKDFVDPQKLQTTAIKAEKEKDDKPHNPRARYKRRDMRAEE